MGIKNEPTQLVEEALTEELWESAALPGSPSIPLLPAVTSLVGGAASLRGCARA